MDDHLWKMVKGASILASRENESVANSLVIEGGIEVHYRFAVLLHSFSTKSKRYRR